MVGSRGSATLQALAALALSAAVAGGLVSLVAVSSRRASIFLADGKERDSLREAALALLDELEADGTPESDWRGDAVWSSAACEPPEGIAVGLRDVSSAINPNYARKTLIERSELISLLAPGASPEGLQQDREDNGLSTDIATRYAPFFSPEGFAYLTGYGFANVNCTDEFVLRSIVASRTGDAAAAEQFHHAIQQALIEKRAIDAQKLELLLGSDYRQVFPLITTEPQINVHFVDARVLRLLVEYPAHEISNPDARVGEILARRETRELSAEEIPGLLGVAAGHALLQYLGVRTWFWEITASTQRRTYRIVAARLPSSGADSTPGFRVVEEAYR